MKRYIKASFDSTIPSWLKAEFDSRSHLAKKFVNKYRVALSDVEFFVTPTGNSLPIYKIGNKVYIPGVNDDDETRINDRWRKFGAIAKSKLSDLADDVVYIDLSANKIANKESYQDPRFSYTRSDPRGHYAGQYYNKSKDRWDTVLPSNEIRSRDKSGYQIPSPESQFTRYYQKFPEKITQKVDKVYNRILEVKDKVLDPNLINTPRDRDEQMSIGNAIYRLRDAIDGYRTLLAELKNFDEAVNSEYSDYAISEYSNAIGKISDSLDEAERNLTSRW